MHPRRDDGQSMLPRLPLRVVLVALIATTAFASATTTAAAAGPLSAGEPPAVFAFVDEFPDAAQQARLLEVASQLSVVAPEWCSLHGSTLGCDAADPQLLALGAANGFAVWPVVNRADPGVDDPLLASAASRREAIQGMVDWAAWTGVGGITLDVEGVSPTRASAFTNFVRQLGRSLHDAGRSLAVYVPRRTDARGSTWSAAYQWGALADASDVLLASSYSESWEAPGPVVTTSGFSDLLSWATRFGPERIAPVLGAVGQRWAAGSSTPTIVPAAAAAAQASVLGVDSQRDGEASYVDGGAVTWFETADGLRQRRAAAAQAGFGWVALFLLGWEPASFWDS
jgi:hypothetical protein